MSNIKEEKKEIISFIKEYDSSFLKDVNLDSERPDVLVNRKGIIGIEHTRIYQPERESGLKIQHQEAIKDKAVLIAKSKYEKLEKVPDLHVSISFEDHYWIDIPREELSGPNVEGISNTLVELVKKNIPEEGEVIQFYKYSGDVLPPEIMRITIVHPRKGGAHGWFRDTGGIIPLLDSNQIQEIIDSKNIKVDDYRRKCSEIWLLMVSNNMQYKRSVVIDNSIINKKYNADFDKVFIFELDFGSTDIYELNI